MYSEAMQRYNIAEVLWNLELLEEKSFDIISRNMELAEAAMDTAKNAQMKAQARLEAAESAAMRVPPGRAGFRERSQHSLTAEPGGNPRIN